MRLLKAIYIQGMSIIPIYNSSLVLCTVIYGLDDNNTILLPPPFQERDQYPHRSFPVPVYDPYRYQRDHPPTAPRPQEEPLWGPVPQPVARAPVTHHVGHVEADVRRQRPPLLPFQAPRGPFRVLPALWRRVVG